MFEVCIRRHELVTALAESDKHIKRGFDSSIPIFKIISVGDNVRGCTAIFSDILTQATIDGKSKCWGRNQLVEDYELIDGKLVLSVLPNDMESSD